MVSRSELVDAGTSIETELKSWLLELGKDDVVTEAWESTPGHLRAILASDYFKGMGPVDRQKQVWDRLNSRVAPEKLRLCFGIHVLDMDEYFRSEAPLN